MNASTLRLMRDTAAYRSISKAARAADISQSAASQAIQEVERDLGVRLFDRSTRPLTITAAGRVYCDFCRDVLRRNDEMRAEVGALAKFGAETARLAAIYSVGLSDMSGIESDFNRRCPQATLEISYLRPERVWQAVANDEADLGLLSYAESSREIVALPWRDEEMVIAAAPGSQIAGHKAVKVEALEGMNFVGFDEDLPIQQHIARFFREHRVSVETVLHFDNIETLKQALAHGAGIGILPERVLHKDVEAGWLVAVRLQPPELLRPVRIIHRRRKVFNRATRGLLELLEESRAEMAIPI